MAREAAPAEGGDELDEWFDRVVASVERIAEGVERIAGAAVALVNHLGANRD